MKYYTSKGFVEKKDETLNDKTKKQAAAITFLSLALALALAIGAWLYTDYVYGEEDNNGEATNTEAVSENNGSGGESAPAKEAVKDNSNIEAVPVQEAEPQREEVQRVEAAPVEEKKIEVVEEKAAVKETVPVEKVTVKIYVRKNSGYSVAQTWTAVANGSNTWNNAKKTANQYSPITEGLTTYTFTGVFKDELGNTWSGDRFYGKDFIALFEGQEGPTATLNVYAQYSEKQFPKLTVIGNDEVSTGSFSWSNDGAFSEYTKTFSEPDEVEGWTFLYWEGEDGEQYEDGDTWTIDASDLDGDTTVTFTAIWEQDEDDPVIDPDDEDVDEDADDDAEFETIYTETIKVKTEAKAEAKTVDSPETGDGHPILGWTIIFILALAGILGGIFRKKN